MPRVFTDRPEYSTRVNLRRYNGHPHALQPSTYQDRAKVLTATCVGWTRADHIRRSKVLMRLIDVLERRWSRLRTAALQKLGTDSLHSRMGWEISGGSTSGMTPAERDAIGSCARGLTAARDLATAHDYVVSRLAGRLAN